MGKAFSKGAASGAETNEDSEPGRGRELVRRASKRLSVAGTKMSHTLKIQQLKAEILLAENKIAAVKKDLGAEIYEPLEKGDAEDYMQVFNEHKTKIDEIIVEIDKRRHEIEELVKARAEAGATPDDSANLTANVKVVENYPTAEKVTAESAE
eukprot:CAMPEP_0206008022 /NCGR_PEP_ID=MMETSP1464-20131121/6654_1 /ASSEMBLY_ACC=CAM_ASM_001124 /TAXON_ID=119497 /ORGANISM="Exanthemachrysis gayraliae, Strain RCC1523" /LENGTH=152 /DNA_ID=CAMNT_0053381547 /DNA_START=11 /DNA_END=469 /DNA_ORIENTATION=-